MTTVNKNIHKPMFKVGEEVLIAPQVTNEKEWLKGIVIDIEDNPFVGFVITAKTKELGEFFDKNTYLKNYSQSELVCKNCVATLCQSS